MNIITHLVAQTTKINPGDIGYKAPATDASKTLTSVLNVIYTWAGIVAVLIVIVAGYIYVTSGGNPSHTKRAREAIIYASVGLVFVIMAFGITQFVIGRF